ncbi:hypothetical protein [Methylotenera sp.]|uniref:hypothetical protein n=2 Tax=Methylotenera sp. TaxID=2051956 RepID=UPI00272D59B2|nr:hypothetical protein [Methylotenera sp.]MDP3308990.1 hypothetical protein [Methylotenera sp.]
MKFSGILFFTTLSLPLTAVACPNGMVFVGDGCSPPYEYTGWSRMLDQHAAEEDYYAGKAGTYVNSLSPEERAELERSALEAEQKKERERELFAKGVWEVSSTSTPEGKLCAATFGKFKLGKNSNGVERSVEGGLVTIMGFQQPKPDAWLMFQGTELPTPRNLKKLKITLQQDAEPAQTVQAFSYKNSIDRGEIAFAVPGLTAALAGMSDKQRFKLSIDGKTAMTIQWTDAAPVIEKLKQCAK